jgi:hypothetical protein
MDEDEFTDFYGRYVEHCIRAGFEPFAPAAAAYLLTELGIINQSVNSTMSALGIGTSEIH